MMIWFFSGLAIGLVYGAGIMLWFWDRAITKNICTAIIDNIKARQRIPSVKDDFDLMRILMQ